MAKGSIKNLSTSPGVKARDALLLSITIYPSLLVACKGICERYLFGQHTKQKHYDLLPLLLYFFFIAIIPWRTEAGDLDTMLIFSGICSFYLKSGFDDAQNYIFRQQKMCILCFVLQIVTIITFLFVFGFQIIPSNEILDTIGQGTATLCFKIFGRSRNFIKHSLLTLLFSLEYPPFQFFYSILKVNSTKSYFLIQSAFKVAKILAIWMISEFLEPEKLIKDKCGWEISWVALENNWFLRMLCLLSTISTLLLWPEKNILKKSLCEPNSQGP